MTWQPIETAPHDETVILANFKNQCLLTGAPHVWTATFVTKWQDGNGNRVEEDPMWCECSFAAMNENGTPTHWMHLPTVSPDLLDTSATPARPSTE